MLDILFSLQFVWISLLVIALSILLALFCTFLQKQLLSMSIGEWLLEHVYCPLAKVILLMFMAFLLFPLIVESITYRELVQLFMKYDFVMNMLNILFVGSLLITFLPGLSHPALALPLLGCIAIGLIFLHQVSMPGMAEISWVPPFSTSMRILLLMFLSYMVTRWLAGRVSMWIDYQFNITGSKVLVTDTNYLILQMPILLAYGHSLQTQASTTL